MHLKSEKYEMDMCNGPLLKKVIAFSLPLMLSGILQLLYNAADIVVVGRYAGSTALAAVGSTSALISLIVNLFMGLSVGASVVVARCYGANDHAALNDAVHTSVTISAISGVIVCVFGLTTAPTLLEMMGTPDDVLDQATLYLRIYFAGMPASMIYNFSSAILRAVGDTRRPLYYLTVSGLVNVALNLFFVIVLHMGVAGVALATVLSQCVSLMLVIACMLRSQGCTHLDPRRLRLHKKPLIEIARVGLPAGLQSSVFSISNVLIQSSVNSFGSAVMAGNAAAGNIEGFVYTGMNAISQASLTFTSQNIGAGRYDRLSRILGSCSFLVTVVGLVMGISAYLGSPWLLQLYTTEDEVARIGALRLLYVSTPYFLCGLMEVGAGMMRGSGYSVTPMIVSVLGACGMRIVWIYTFFAAVHTLPMLYVSYPISWLITAAVHMLCFLFVWRKMPHAAVVPDPVKA